MSAAGNDSGSDDDSERGGREAFFHCLDRVPSGLHIDADFPSDDDDVRVSFASAMGDHHLCEDQAMLDEEEEAEDPVSNYDYGMWMSNETMSIQERRRRLHQGMGLVSSRDLILRARTRKLPPDIPRSVSRLQPQPSQRATPPAASETAPSVATTQAAVVAAALQPVLNQQPAKSITRCRSDTGLAVRNGAPESAKLPPFSRAHSFLTSQLVRDNSPIHKAQGVAARDATVSSAAAAAAEYDGKGNARSGEAGDAEGNLKIKNLDDGKEFAVADVSKDSSNVLNLQTGVHLSLEEFEKFLGYTPIVKHFMRRGQGQAAASDGKGAKPSKKKGGWLKNIKSVAIGLIQDKDGSSKSASASTATMSQSASANAAAPSSGSERLKVHHYGKSCKELSGLYMCQEIHAHEGSIWTIKFSTDARYLASAGEDRVVRVWQVTDTDTSSLSILQYSTASLPPPPPGAADGPSPAVGAQLSKKTRGKSGKDALPEHIVVPDTVPTLAKKPVCTFEGHLDDVLDLSWSKSQQLLSSSMDKTVRLWDMETKTCLKTFAHSDYVTCVQFNPVDEGYFISGSLDAKVRIWRVPERQVVDWTDLKEMVTAASYTPDGQGAVAGSHKGSVRFYKTAGDKLNQEAQIDIQTKKRKSQAKKITGFQFAPGNPSQVLVTSADSQVRVFDGVSMVQKFRGFKNTSSQLSACYTTDGRYVVCASEDSHVYVWKTARSPTAPAPAIAIGMKPKTWCTTRSYENFFCKDVSAAIPWPHPVSPPGQFDGEPWSSSPCCTDEVCSMPSHPKPGPSSEPAARPGQPGSSDSVLSSRLGSGDASGLAVVTASLGGEIRIYQNFGMPLRIRGQSNLFY